MIRFKCCHCRSRFQAQRFNVANITINCPSCNFPNHIAQSIRYVYGKIVGEQVETIIESLSRVAERSKTDLSIVIDSTYAKILTLCSGAGQ